MKLGLHIGYWAQGVSWEDHLRLVREAEELGFDSVWAAEAYGSDAATVLAWLAAQTSRIRLGSAVFQIPGRSAAMTAMTAATIDRLSGGRMILGLGASGPQVAEGWHGQRFAGQIQRTREYVAVVRMALERRRVRFAGETIELPLGDRPDGRPGQGKALKLTIRPIQERIPIYLAAIGPRNTELAGEIADGWMPLLSSPAHLARARESLQRGAVAAGRSIADIDIAPNLSLLIDDDQDTARDAARGLLALYVGGMGSRRQNFYRDLVARQGFAEEARRVQDLYLEGRRGEAMAAIPSELIDMVTLCGPAESVAVRLRAYKEAGVGTLGVTPLADSAPERLRQLGLLAELAAEL